MNNKYLEAEYQVTEYWDGGGYGMRLVLYWQQYQNALWEYEVQQRRFILTHNHVWVDAAGHLANFFLEGGKAYVLINYDLKEPDEWWEIDDWTPLSEGANEPVSPCGRDPPHTCPLQGGPC